MNTKALSTNGKMDVLSAIHTRTTAPRLGEPGPTPQQLEQILQAAIRAPDHGRLEPWRFVIVEGDARRRLGAAMAEGLRLKDPGVQSETLEREAAKTLRAPTIVVVAASLTEGRIPVGEQLLSVGAAVQNMLLAAHALGVASAWKTGASVYEPAVKTVLGLQNGDQVIAFVYLGAQEQNPPLRTVSLEGRVSRL